MNKFYTVASCLLIVFTIVGLFIWKHQLSPYGNGATVQQSSQAHVPRSQPMVLVSVPTLTPSALQGERIFNKNCAACHGANGAGQDGIAPPLIHKLYEPSHHNDDSFYRAAANGVIAHHWPYGNMPPITTVTPEDMAKIIRYIRELQAYNGIK